MQSAYMFRYVTVGEAKALAPVAKVRRDHKQIAWIIEVRPQDLAILDFAAYTQDSSHAVRDGCCGPLLQAIIACLTRLHNICLCCKHNQKLQHSAQEGCRGTEVSPSKHGE